MEEKFVRKYKEDKPVVAICYDFDKTLTPENMQEQGYIQSVGEDIEEFWKGSNVIAEENDMDQNLAYMFFMTKKSKDNDCNFTKEMLHNHGSKVKLFNGVKEWFKRIEEYGKEKGVIVEHYIISSGLKEMIEGTSIANEFTKIYASSFYFDESGEAIWPAQAVNYTNKTQFLFRIEKGVLDVNDQGVNDHFDDDKLRVPFRNMVYIGDSDTDIPCMKLVNSYGGYSIGVYDPNSKDKTKVYRMIKDERIKFFAPADYTEGSEIDVLLKNIIDKTSFNERIEKSYSDAYREMKSNIKYLDDNNQLIKEDLISKLEASKTFRNTHNIINSLSEFNEWSEVEIEKLIEIFIFNNQVKWISKDDDVFEFYSNILNKLKEDSQIYEKIMNLKKENDTNCNSDEKVGLNKLREIIKKNKSDNY